MSVPPRRLPASRLGAALTAACRSTRCEPGLAAWGLFIALLLGFGAARGVAQQAPATTPAITPTPAAPASGRAESFTNVAVVNGAVFLSSLKEFSPTGGVAGVRGVRADRVPLLQQPEFTGLFAERFSGKPLNRDTMLSLQRDVVRYFFDHDRPIVDVFYPPQRVVDGVLQVIVLEGRLNRLVVTTPELATAVASNAPAAASGAGTNVVRRVVVRQVTEATNLWSSPAYLRRVMDVPTNEPLSLRRIEDGLDRVNRNRFRKVGVVLTPAATSDPDKRYGYSDVVLAVDERKPWEAFVGYDDTGSRATDLGRVSAGVEWGNVFGLSDHNALYQFTANPGFDKLLAHSGQYSLPLPWQHTLRFFGYYLDVAGKDDDIDLTGRSFQTSFRYEAPLPRLGRIRQEAGMGLDFKSIDNGLQFNEITVQDTPWEVFQFTANYVAMRPDAWGQTLLRVALNFSPGGISDLNTDEAFQLVSPFATAAYFYSRLEAERSFDLPLRMRAVLRGTAQLSPDSLVPSEQFGLGGFATVRGFDERDVNADEGWSTSMELYSPPIAVAEWLARQFRVNHVRRDDDGLRFLGFVDYGQAWNLEPLIGEETRRLGSVGLGLRYAFRRNLELRFDYGWPFEDQGALTPEDSRGHVGVRASY